jgi:dTMP kinase
MLAKIICVEGADRSGKATQTKMLVSTLEKRGQLTTRVEIPFNDRLTYWLIYKMLANKSAKKYPNLFQFVNFLNKFYFQCTVLLWLLLTNEFVILDRWALSSIIYGSETGTNKFLTKILYSMLVKPKITLVMNGSSFKRDEVMDVYEVDTDLQKRVKTNYYNWAQEHSSNHVLIDNQGSVNVVHHRIISNLNFLGITQDYDTKNCWWNSETGQWEIKQ